jgi:hypothetical protein
MGTRNTKDTAAADNHHVLAVLPLLHNRQHGDSAAPMELGGSRYGVPGRVRVKYGGEPRWWRRRGSLHHGQAVDAGEVADAGSVG